MMRLLRQLITSFCFILILTIGIGQEFTTGCMDDGYQQWSPNPGSPACNYNQFAIIEGECLYNNCLGICKEILDNNGNWILNSNFADVQYDECGECGGDGSTCSDCNGVPNGTAYINPSCIDNINVNGCVGGDTGNSDCLNIELSFDGFLISDSTETIKVFVTNLDTLQSLDIEFQYDSSILDTMLFSLNGTALENIGYNIEDTTFIVSDNLSQVNFTLYFEPHTTNFELFSLSGREHIFNIVLEAPFEIEVNTITQIIINEISVNEILMDNSNWEGGEISVMMHAGCTDEVACNYDLYAGSDDGSCLYDDVCGECDGNETIAHNCDCTDANEYDCNGYCILDCPDEFSFTPGCAVIDPNCTNVCIGGSTERYPCEQDCAGEWGGIAYKDNCDECIADINDIDCFNSGFKIYDSNGIEVDTLKESDIFYVALHMTDLPNLLEGVIININFTDTLLSFLDSNLDPNEFDTDSTMSHLLDSSYKLYFETSDNGVFLADIYLENTNVFPQGNNGNVLFLKFFNLGDNGDSTVISYNEILVNEHAMKDANYTSKVIYFGDCDGGFGGTKSYDDCGVCNGPGAIYECLNGEYVGEVGGCHPKGDCGDGTESCECGLSINEKLIPQSYTLSQNYPNPFNPITYIRYSVPNFDFININIINVSGQIIKTIVNSSHQPGNYEIIWDGTNHYEISVPSGIYFYKMDANEFASVKKLVLLK